MNTVRDLHAAACQAFERAYAPYSGFKVGAAVLDDCGHISRGCNVENVSYPCGTSAEAGGKKIREILIVADSRELIKPCGACLQRIAEFAAPETPVHLADSQNVRQTFKLSDLLPQAFNAEELSE